MFSLRRLTLTLAAIAAIAGCDSSETGTQTGTDPRDDDLFEPGCDLETAVKVRPTGTYFRTNADNPDIPTLIALSDLDLASGDRVLLKRFGEYQFKVTGDPTAVRRGMGAVFSSSNDLLDETEPARVVDALDAGEDFVSRVTATGDLPTDIPEDFEVSDSTVVTVPDGAAYLFVGPTDDLFQDNADEDDDFRVCLTEVS